MTKKISLILASLTLAIACSFFITGKVIENNYYQTIAKLNKQPNIKVSLVNYSRGFFTSNADVTVEFASDDPSDKQVLSLKQVITHGPVIAANTQNGHSIKILAAQIKTSFGEPWKQRLEEYTTSKQPLYITTLVKFSDQATTWIRITGADQTTPTQFHVAWDAVNGSIEHNFNFDYYHGFINLPKLVVDTPTWKFTLQNLTLNLDANKKDAKYSSSNTMTTQLITYTKEQSEVIKLDGITAKLAFFNQDNNLALDLEAKVAKSKILDQEFTDDSIKLQANNLNPARLSHLPRITAIGAKGTIDLLQDLTVASTDVTLELPKDFTEAFISYLSYEIYRNSYLGKFDPRPGPAVLHDITGSINKLVQGAVQQQLFIEKDRHYALNFNRPAQG